MEQVGQIGVIATRVPRVEIDAAEVDQPEQAGEILDYRESLRRWRRGGRMSQVGIHVGFGVGGMFLEKKFAEGSVGVAFHDHGSVHRTCGQEGWGDVGVVLEEVALGDFVFGPEGFLEVG